MTTSADSPAPALRLDSLGVAYGRRSVLAGVTGEVAPGGSLALIGPNGAGKSTLFKLVTGGMPVTSGRIALAGDDITGLSPAKRARRAQQ